MIQNNRDFGPLRRGQISTLLVVRPFCHNDHYWQVHFDTNRAIAKALANAKFPVPAEYSVEYEYEWQMD